jgi:hypothetical protein
LLEDDPLAARPAAGRARLSRDGQRAAAALQAIEHRLARRRRQIGGIGRRQQGARILVERQRDLRASRLLFAGGHDIQPRLLEGARGQAGRRGGLLPVRRAGRRWRRRRARLGQACLAGGADLAAGGILASAAAADPQLAADGNRRQEEGHQYDKLPHRFPAIKKKAHPG